jgi:5-methylcytosine-specific restriction endonuclease McrA
MPVGENLSLQRKKQHTDDWLLDHLRQFVRESGDAHNSPASDESSQGSVDKTGPLPQRWYGRGLGTRDFEAWPHRKCSSSTILLRFGTWREAMERIGVHGVKARAYPPGDLIRELERVWTELGRAPGEGSWLRTARFSLGAYKRIWGSLRRCCDMLTAYRDGRITREQLLTGAVECRTSHRGLAPRARHAGRTRTPSGLKSQRANAAQAGYPGRRQVPIRVRWAVIRRDRYRCIACGRNPAAEPGVELHIDHILPVSRGGDNEMANLRTLCRECNVGRGEGG